MPLRKKIIVEGVTKEGRTFRPSDWAERMSGALSRFGYDHRIHYSPLLYPTTINGIKCITVDLQLRETNPEVYKYIMSFAETNHLNTYEIEENEGAPAL
ncbi:MAG: acetyltransferase [Gammaproteobacteria bacterium RBG_16_57_12]|nr:MAG: acetyltransferase [Gammaproteobacteria bacterium RBG_16_57_12]